ncbi:ornithine/acetylornithine aminotransferase [Candidatus Scalindua japonica]|uniref:Ornithine/acetylornithine aminotransferase n=2 Tax=Candidatus Scalindua japonica TaxID=1284222 RepID=A0A286TV09_9BACT|nr:ornithine/acetylornithine aminotransferase [Candidatus Scalindua japonica]
MRAEYDFKSGVRGKHYRLMQNGCTITIHKENGKSVIKEVLPKEGVVVLYSDMRPYF